MAQSKVKKAQVKKGAVKKSAKTPAAKAASAKGTPLKQAEKQLIAYALTFPEAVLEHPWGHDAVKVKGKMFATFGGAEGDPKEMSMTVKLPLSGEMALTLRWVESTGYGLGKSGWVTARVRAARDIDLETMKGWIGQSYRAVAPKGLVKTLG
jgi:predicted DNA-binding protein (MmcQ/YjbR family)